MTHFSRDSHARAPQHDAVPKKNHGLKKSRRTLKRILIVCLVFLILIGILVVIGLTNYQDARAAYDASLRGKENLEKAQVLVQEQKLTDARASLVLAHEEFLKAQKHTDKLSELKALPMLGRQIRAVENILVAGTQLTSALEKIVAFGDEILAVIQEDQDVSISEITPEQKAAILQKMYEAPPDLQGAKAEVDLAVLAMNRVPERGILSSIRQASLAVQEKLPLIKEIIDKAVPAIETLPLVAGYPESKTYLFLLQNNTEMRATGGFIGTYGILEVENGEIQRFTTDNIYNLDNRVKDSLFITPPWQLTKYLGSKQWFLRDSNWEPDFPTAAAKAEEFYQLEAEKPENIDGLIAVTPTFIQSLLEITGPITAKGIEFTSENFVDTLQYQVEVAFYQQGLSDSQRKDVIGDLSDKLMNELMALPKERWSELWFTFQKDINQKQILLHMRDGNIQSLLSEQGWTGEVKQTDSDFALVVDSNFASLKSDPVVKRTIRYSVSDDKDHGLVGRLEIHYRHEGGFEWKTTRYRTYTRVYVPQGSELLEYDGVMENDKLHGGKAGEVETADEFGKTRFGGFISIEPDQEGTLTFVYKLPERIRNQIETGEYSFLAQKQSGTISHALEVTFDVGRKIDTYSPLDIGQREGDNTLRFSTDLTVDREFSLELK